MKKKSNLVVLTHGKETNLANFDPICVCPECFSDKLLGLDKGNETYILHEGVLFNKICSVRTFCCVSCDCEFMQFGKDVRREKREDFEDRIRLFSVIFLLLLAVSGLICAIVFACKEQKTLSLISIGISIVSTTLCSFLCSSYE